MKNSKVTTNDKIKQFYKFLNLIYQKNRIENANEKVLNPIFEICSQFQNRFEKELNFELPFDTEVN